MAPDGPVRTLAHGEWVYSLAVNATGTRLASGSTGGTIKVWDTANGRCVATLEGHEETVGGLAFHPDGARLASAGKDGTIRIWSIGDGEMLQGVRAHQAPATEVRFSPDGTRLYTSGLDSRIGIWEHEKGTDGFEIKPYMEAVSYTHLTLPTIYSV